MRIEEPGASRTFVKTLSQENGWPLAYAHAVSREYRRFLYLAATAPGPVTPSVAVDRAWHLHLTYSRHYWEILCGRILHRPLHHHPSEGGEAEEARHFAQYVFTLRQYEATFGELPRQDVWPRPAAPRRTDLRRSQTRPTIGQAATLAIIGVVAAAAAFGVGGFAVAVILAGMFLWLILTDQARAEGRKANCSGGCAAGGVDCPGCGSSCGGGCGGGCG